MEIYRLTPTRYNRCFRIDGINHHDFILLFTRGASVTRDLLYPVSVQFVFLYRKLHGSLRFPFPSYSPVIDDNERFLNIRDKRIHGIQGKW